MYVDNLMPFFSFLSVRLCLLRHPVYTCIRRNDASTSTREWKSFHSLVLVLMLESLHHMCKLGQRKHKHKGKHKALMLALYRFTCRFLMLVACV